MTPCALGRYYNHRPDPARWAFKRFQEAVFTFSHPLCPLPTFARKENLVHPLCVFWSKLDTRIHNETLASLRSEGRPVCSGTGVHFAPVSLSSFTGIHNPNVSNTINTIRQAQPYLRTVPFCLGRLRILLSGPH